MAAYNVTVRDSFTDETKTVCVALTERAARSNAAEILNRYRFGYGYRVRILERGRAWRARYFKGYSVTVKLEPRRATLYIPHIVE